jgi:glycosyltransferase involved in cell wall biosynthesis
MSPHGATAASSGTPIGSDIGLVVHSHLRWDFVWQRPQQLLSRIAATNPVLFVEEPVVLDDLDVPALDLTSPVPGVTRAIPRIPSALAGDFDTNIALVRTLLETLFESPTFAAQFQRVVQWFYTPMPAPVMLGAFNEVAVVYDCMDELAQFRFAPSDIGARERQLLSQADVVFTGGYQLFESKKRYHANVHFFGCGVDAVHFGKARLPETVVPDDATGVASPVFGYFGVIDERLDYTLIDALAAARPDATVLMIGPFAKVDPKELPQAPNIRWLGQKAYADLPRYVKAFDVCLMPFALNEATEYINPTKTLEYMASGKPIVSTPVADVVRNFAPIVRIAAGPSEFVKAVSESAAVADESLTAAGIMRSASATWESIVGRMREIIGAAILSESAGSVEKSDAPRAEGISTRSHGWRARTPAKPSLDRRSETGGAVP